MEKADESDGPARDEGRATEAALGCGHPYEGLVGVCLSKGGSLEIIPWEEGQRRESPLMKTRCCPKLTMHTLGTSCPCI